jgi:hypothetical protein
MTPFILPVKMSSIWIGKPSHTEDFKRVGCGHTLTGLVFLNKKDEKRQVIGIFF